jgi:hypothetical protein
LAPSQRGLSAQADWGSVPSLWGHPHHHFVVPLPQWGRQDFTDAFGIGGRFVNRPYGFDFTIFDAEFIVVFTTIKVGCIKSVTKLNTFYSRNTKNVF